MNSWQDLLSNYTPQEGTNFNRAPPTNVTPFRQGGLPYDNSVGEWPPTANRNFTPFEKAMAPTT